MYVVLIDPTTWYVVECIPASFSTYEIHYQSHPCALYVQPDSFPTTEVFNHFVENYGNYRLNEDGSLRYKSPTITANDM